MISGDGDPNRRTPAIPVLVAGILVAIEIHLLRPLQLSNGSVVFVVTIAIVGCWRNTSKRFAEHWGRFRAPRLKDGINHRLSAGCREIPQMSQIHDVPGDLTVLGDRAPLRSSAPARLIARPEPMRSEVRETMRA